MTDKSFKQHVREHLEDGQTLTRDEAYQLYSSHKLPARIAEFRAEGIVVEDTDETTNGKTYKRYWFADEYTNVSEAE